MRGRMLASISLAAMIAVAVAASLSPLKVKTGLWDIASTVTWTGLPPELAGAMANGRKHSYQKCVKTEDLNTNPWAEGSRNNCMWTVLSSTGTDMDLQGTSCDMGRGMTGELHGKIHILDAEDGTGSFDVTLMGNGQTMMGHASYVGKWVGSSCPAE